MELVALWHMLQRRWWLMVLPAVLVLVLSLPALPSILNPPTSYAVAMRFTAAAPADIANLDDEVTYEDSAYVPWLASEYVVVNMPQWATSDSFAREVSTLLAQDGLDIAPEDVRPAFNADSARSIFVLYINWDDEAEIEAIAQAAVTVLQTRNQVYFPQFASAPAAVEALDDIRVNTVATPLTTRLNPLLRIIIAGGAGIALALLAEYLDDTIRDEADMNALEMPLMGRIPRA